MIDYKEGDIIVALPSSRCTTTDHVGLNEMRGERSDINGKLFRALGFGESKWKKGRLLVDIGDGQGPHFCAGCFKKVPEATTDIFSLTDNPIDLEVV